MAFITDNDYLVNIRNNNLQMIIESNNQVLRDAESRAIAVVKDSLHSRYDTEEIFSQTDDDRAQQVLWWCINLVTYYIYNRIPDSQVPQRVVKNYNDTLSYLMEVADGKKAVDLPRLQDDDKPRTKFRWGSQKQKTHE